MYLETILTSVLVSTIITGLLTLLAKNIDFKNQYYKEIITKRIDTYQEIEKIIATLNSTIIKNDNKPYHGIFNRVEGFNDAYILLAIVLTKRMWISPKTYKLLIILNRIFFEISDKQNNKNDEEIINLGKESYINICDLRDFILVELSKDYKNLYKIPKFLKNKQKNPK